MAKAGNHVITWFEIPVSDLQRAAAFYGGLLDAELTVEQYGPVAMAVFPADGDAPGTVVHGALVQGDGYAPGAQGALVYFDGGEDLAVPLARVEGLGGRVVQPKTPIGDHGFMAVFLDTEGNKVALHSMK